VSSTAAVELDWSIISEELRPAGIRSLTQSLAVLLTVRQHDLDRYAEFCR